MIKGIVRNIDGLGRVTLPKEMRKTAGIGIGDPVDIYFNDKGAICIEPCLLQCVCCGNTKVSLKEFNGVHMCRKCINEFKED